MERPNFRMYTWVGLVLALASCSKPKAEVAEAEPAPPAMVEATPQPASTSSTLKTGLETAPLSTVAPDPMAPAGVFFLLTKASVVTDEGIVGLPPGTRLEAAGPGEYKDPQGHTVKLEARQVTNNLRLAKQATRSDVSTQAAIQQQTFARTRVVPAAQVQGATPPVVSLATRSAPANPGGPGPSVGNKPIFDSGSLGATHSSSKEVIKRDEQGKRYYTDRGGKRHYLD